MYYLIYDQFLSHPKYQKDLAQIETHLTDLGIVYKTVRHSLLKSLPELVQTGIKQKAHTIVAVGSDEIIGQIVNIIAQIKNVTLGVVPIGEKSYIADFLGIPVGRESCDVLSARKIEIIDLGKIADQYFMISVEAKDAEKIFFEFDHDYRLKPTTPNHIIGVYNFNYHTQQWNHKVSPQNGLLYAMIIPKESSRFPFFKKTDSLKWGSESIIPTKNVKLLSADTSPAVVLADRSRVFKTPLTVTVLPKQLRVIVGAERLF